MISLIWLSQLPIICHILRFFKYILIKALRSGELPNHVAFIMDGNRRYAKLKHLPVTQGHEMGSESLASILELCYKLDIKAVSIYAFSIENFKRSKSEINYLMNLMKKKLEQISENGQLVDTFGIRIIFSGNLNYLSKDILQSFKKTEERTKKNNNVILNICFPYTSRDDITRAIKTIVEDSIENKQTDEIDENLITNNLDSKNLPPLNLLIRTSGVRRLSDYLLWEITNNDTEIEFLDVFWPELDQFTLCWCLLKWSFKKTSLNDFYKEDKIKID